MVGFVTTLLFQGVLWGVGIRAILPGEQRWTIPQTIGIGVVVSLTIGFVFRAILSAVFGLIVPLLLLGGIYLFFAGRRRGPSRR